MTESATTTATVSAISTACGATPFVLLSDDIVLNIVAKLESDPRDWARLTCVSARFAALVRNVCCRAKCSRVIPADLLPSPADAAPAAVWAALHKLAVCCPGLLQAGILLENSDFGLEREIGPDESYQLVHSHLPNPHQPTSSNSPTNAVNESCWSLFDDLYFDTVYDVSESHTVPELPSNKESDKAPILAGRKVSKKRKRQCSGQVDAHLASGVWNLSREQGNKLLASRFRGDCLYICDWPGCVHAEEKRKYMLFRGIFKNFKRSRVWRTIIDASRKKIDLHCAFCACTETWDLHSAFCLRRVFGFHDDGEPVVRAYVCENGHVSGAWTERPMYT